MKRFFHRRNERGAALVLVVLSIVATMSMTGLVVDGSNAYAQRRQMQNAADAAALAGTRALNNLVVNGEAAVWTAVLASAQSNGATASLVQCSLTDELLVVTQACPTTNNGQAATIKLQSTAVQVTVGSVTNTSFMRVVGTNNFTARASAAAQIEGLRSGNSPFVLCATGNTDPRSLGDGQAVPIIMPDNSMNPGAIFANGGPIYELQDPTTIGCGQNNAYKGLSENATTAYPTPGVWDLLNGDHGINVSKSVVAGTNACTNGVVDGCVIAIPLCHAATPPVAFELYCERFGAFQIVDTGGSSRLGGKLLGNVLATGGQGGGRPEAGEMRVIKLSA
ncbi:MAG: hypothetical protein QOJ00_453 [Actinomycetota bacterium]|jgi:Flp pilus assembly protein TadG